MKFKKSLSLFLSVLLSVCMLVSVSDISYVYADPDTQPAATPVTEPTTAPTTEPTTAPTTEPAAVPTTEPTAAPTTAPTAEPTAAPTAAPTTEPTAAPTTAPTTEPTAAPTAAPTTEPTAAPTTAPTAVPTATPDSSIVLPTPDALQGALAGAGSVMLNSAGNSGIATVTDSIGFDAGIYKDADRTVLDTQLTATGAFLSGWEYNHSTSSTADRYLGVNISNLSSTEQYRVVVEMSPLLYVNQNNEISLAGTTVSYTKNADIVVNGKYSPNKYSFSNLTYLINEGTTGLTISLPLRFDINLWNKQNNGILGNGTDPLLKVYLQQKQADDSFATVENLDVNLLTATVSGSVPYSVSTNYSLAGTSVSTNSMGKDDTMKMVFSQFSSITYSGGHYAENVQLQIKIPTCTVDGTVYTLNYLNNSFTTSGGTAAFTENYDAATGILTMTAEKLYFGNSALFQISFTAPDALKSIPGNYAFNGSIAAVSDGVTICSSWPISITLDTGTQAKLEAKANTGKASIINLDVVQPLGGLAIKNDAAKENGSGPILIELLFDANNTNHTAVTTVNLMCDRTTEYIDIYYTLVDRDGNPAYLVDGTNQVFYQQIKNTHYSTDPNAKISESHYITFHRGKLDVAEHRDYFFDTFTYTMGNLPGQSAAYHTGASLAPYSAGTFWGYITTDTVPSVKPTNTMNIYRKNADNSKGEKLLTATATSGINAGTSVPYYLEGGSVSATSVNAGDTVTVKGTVRVIRYPYSSSNALNDLILGFVLPDGIALNTASLSATCKNGSLGIKKVTTTALPDDKVLYTAELESFATDQRIGHFAEDLGTLPGGDYMNFSVQLNSEKTISTQTVYLKEFAFVAAKNQVNCATGSFQDCTATDVNDLNQNGSVTDNIGGFDKDITTSITFQSPPAQLKITDTLSNSEGDAGSSVAMESFADIINYELNIECTEGGTAKDFYYIIPVASQDMTPDSDFVKTCQFDIDMINQPTVSNLNGTPMKLLYSTTPVNSYSEALTNINDWSETLPDGKTWKDVTMIKVLSSQDIIVNGSSSKISVPLQYVGSETGYDELAGMKISWSSRGYYYYQLGYNINSSTKSTTGCTIVLTYTPQEPVSIELTAAKGTPKDPTASKSRSFDLPVFKNAQRYTVADVMPYNVNLMGSGYDFSTASSTAANENFRIKVSVKDSALSGSGSTPVAIEKGNEYIGSLGGNTAPEFTFTIENADALSDIVTTRKVTLTLIGDNGVVVPVIITIKRELAAADPTDPAIVAGKLYSPFVGIDEIEVSNDSAFTAQFITSYYPINYKNHSIVFDKAPASGTKITMIDHTDSDTLGFYQYTLNGTETTVKLSAFNVMSTTSDYFVESSEGNLTLERLLFIVSFPETGETVRKNSIKMTKQFKSDSSTEESSELFFETVANREFSLSFAESSSVAAKAVAVDESFDVYYKSECSVTDSRYTGRALSLVVSSDSTIPAESYLRVNNVNYHLTSDGTFLVPLKNVQQGNGSASVSFHSDTVDSISLKFELWASATAEGVKPMMGEKVADSITATVSCIQKPSFIVSSANKQLIYKDALKNTITYTFDVLNAETLTVELQKKDGADYVTQTAILESVNGKTTPDAGQGMFSIDSSVARSVDFKISESAPAGTYRMLFTISNKNKSMKVPYNFIISD